MTAYTYAGTGFLCRRLRLGRFRPWAKQLAEGNQELAGKTYQGNNN